MSTSKTEAKFLLDTLREDPTSWPKLLAVSSTSPQENVDRDTNRHNRSLVLLELHDVHRLAPASKDEVLVLYLLDEETRYCQKEGYRSSLSLAAYLLARYRNPVYIWAIWTARTSDYDASVCVDTHLVYYAGGGMNKTENYVKQSEVGDFLKGAPVGGAREVTWNWYIEDSADGKEETAFEDLKCGVLERIAECRRCGITDDKVEMFMVNSWRTDTGRWAGSLLTAEEEKDWAE